MDLSPSFFDRSWNEWVRRDRLEMNIILKRLLQKFPELKGEILETLRTNNER